MPHLSTPRPRWMGVAPLALASALLAATGCAKSEPIVAVPPASVSSSGSSPGGSTPGSTASSTPVTSESPDTSAAKTTSTTASKPDAGADKDIAEASVLTIKDLPDGFTKKPSPDSERKQSPFIGVPACADYEDIVKESNDHETADVDVKFADGTSDTELTNSFELYDEASIAERSAEAIGDAGFPACMEEALGNALQDSLPAAATVDSVTVTRNDELKADDYGVDSLDAYFVEVAVTGDKGSETFAIATIFYTSGRALGELTGQSSDGTLAQAIVASTIQPAMEKFVEGSKDA